MTLVEDWLLALDKDTYAQVVAALELLAERGTHRIGDMHQAISGHIYIHDVTQLEISSSEIRELVAVGRDARFLMPDAVRKVIEQSGCYAVVQSTGAD